MIAVMPIALAVRDRRPGIVVPSELGVITSMRIAQIAPLHEAVLPKDYLATYRRLAADERPARRKRLKIINSGNGASSNIQPYRGGYGMNALRKRSRRLRCERSTPKWRTPAVGRPPRPKNAASGAEA